MNNLSPIRLLILLAAGVLLALLLLLALLFTDTLLSIRANLATAHDWLWWLVIAGFTAFGLASFWLFLRLLRPRKQAEKPTPANLDEQGIAEQIERDKRDGLDTRDAENELRALRQRREAGDIHIALYGEISSGKSSLIKALLPMAEVEVAVTGGTTRDIHEYRWTSPSGDRLILTDMPGLNENDDQRPLMAEREAQRAHVVIYVCDADLTRSQAKQIGQLAESNKPVILALSKSDRYSKSELEQIEQRLDQRAHELGIKQRITISSGGMQQIVRVNADGSEEIGQREKPPQVDALQRALQRQIDGDRQLLESLRDSAVFSLIAQQLDAARAEQRETRAEQITRDYAKKAVVASVATVTPGTDLLIQGYLATQMIKELAELYEAPVRNIDIDLLLKLIQQHVRSRLTLLLAIAGNALKAFPGMGTLGGGVAHAIAYGFLFETLGKSIAGSLRTRGELHPLQVADQFEDKLGEGIETSAGYYARLALQQIRNKD
jgi:small GTP-binding protein